ncbi:MAG: hypothetical protein J6Y65_01800 [Eggerthellaceae bacterium]|nr:hypothetical protein [Eggerthellaceae bacterium]
MQKHINITRVEILTGRMRVDVTLSEPYCSTPQLAQKLVKEYPGIQTHACKNAEGKTFGCVMDHTSLAHVLEHIIVHLQATRECDKSVVFAGNTRWINQKEGRAHIEVSFNDDLVALASLKKAVAFLNEN